MLRNAELSQQYENLKRSSSQEKSETDAELSEKIELLSSVTSRLDEREKEVTSLQQEVSCHGDACMHYLYLYYVSESEFDPLCE